MTRTRWAVIEAVLLTALALLLMWVLMSSIVRIADDEAQREPVVPDNYAESMYRLPECAGDVDGWCVRTGRDFDYFMWPDGEQVEMDKGLWAYYDDFGDALLILTDRG